MSPLIIFAIIALIGIIVFQISRISELSSVLRDDENSQEKINKSSALSLFLFMIGFLILCVASAWYYKDWMLGYGPHSSASVHGNELDSMFNITLVLTGIVFIITHIALFWFPWKYRGRANKKALYYPHNNRLEIIWSVIPAVVMFFLVIRGLIGWNEVMSDISPGEDFIEIEATGSQFLWYLRYPGNDGALGARDLHLINGINPLGQDWQDPKNLDDLHPTELVLPVNKKVRVRITSRDVLHNFYLPHFRVKMDAVPGIPTYFVFTPKTTTEEYREQLRQNGKYDFPYDPEDPESNPYWKEFNYELACAELCGASHFSMKKIVKIVTQDEYDEWLTTQKPYYLSTVRGSDDDPFKDQLLDIEIKERNVEFTSSIESAMAANDVSDKVVALKYVHFETGSSQLTSNSQYQLATLINILNKYPNVSIDLMGHTDNTGDIQTNMTISQERADAVKAYLAERGIEETRMSAQGFGPTRPIDSNDTDSGRQNNRRTEIRINN